MEISITAILVILGKFLMVFVVGVFAAILLLAPINDKPAGPIQKVCYGIIMALAVAIIFDVVRLVK